jgi:hypothetical protein
MKVLVYFSSQTTIIEIANTDSVVVLKRKIYEQLLVLTSMQSLCIDSPRGMEMLENYMLSDYDLKEDSGIYLSVKKHVITSSTSSSKKNVTAESPRGNDSHKMINYSSPQSESILKSPRSLMKVHFDDKHDVFAPASTSKSLSFLAKIEEETDNMGNIKSNKQPPPINHKANTYQTNSIPSKYQHKDEDSDIKDALSEELYSEYTACSFYGLLCKYEFFKLSLKYALRARNMEEAKKLATQLSDLSYIPRDADGNAFDMRYRIISFISKLKERYDHLAEESNVTGCCICMDALSEMTELLTDNQADDTKEFELCCNYPKLCKYELINEGIKSALHTQQIERAKYLQSQLLVLNYKPEGVGVTAVDMKGRLVNIRVRLKERYTLSADRADIDDSVYCIELLSKIEQLILQGETAISEEKDSLCSTKDSLDNYAQNILTTPSSSDTQNLSKMNDSIQKSKISSPSPENVRTHGTVSTMVRASTPGSIETTETLNTSKSSLKSPSKASPSQSYIAKYLAATSAAVERETTVLSGKWWLMDEDDDT